MPSIVPNKKIEDVLRKLLTSEGYSLSKPKAYGETGTDIVAEKRSSKHHIEVIAYKSSGPARAKDFFQAFFRVISRIKEGASSCVIAMPKEAERGLPARASQYGESWIRIGKAFPELEIWLVDTLGDSYRRTKWNDWAD
jgi:hypothetical protein